MFLFVWLSCYVIEFSYFFVLSYLNGWIALGIILDFFAECLLLKALILKCLDQMLSEPRGSQTTADMDPQITAQFLKWQLSTKIISHSPLLFWSKFGFLNHYCKFGINIGFNRTSTLDCTCVIFYILVVSMICWCPNLAFWPFKWVLLF